MSVAPHLIHLYKKTSRRYRKLVSKLQRESVSGWQRKSFLHELKKLLKKLRDLHVQLKIAAATGSVVLILNASSANAQGTPPTLGPFVLQDRTNNPLREPIFTFEPIMTVVDFDQDGDGDVVLGEYNNVGGKLRYFENKSSEGSPVYIELEGSDNPLDGILGETIRVAPAFADIDKDGDQDLFLGQNGTYAVYHYGDNSTRGIEYYRNDGGTFTRQTGPWNSGTGAGNPFDGVKFGYEISPAFADLDKDGDVDFVAGSFIQTGTYPSYVEKYIHYYVNDGNGNFTPSNLTITSNPDNFGYDPLYPAFGDLDEDGDLDMVMGTYYDGTIRYYKQDAPGSFTEQTTAWDPVAKTGNPFKNYNVGLNSSPAFIDFNNDQHLDLLLADQLGYFSNKYSDKIINYYENSGNGSFFEKDDFENPFDGVYAKQYAAPAVLDIDGDNDLDAIIGNKYTTTYYDYTTLQYVTVNSYLNHYRNSDGLLKKISGDTNPFDTLEVYGDFVPQFEDIDGDNDLDLISGNYNGEVTFFRNDNGVYKLETTTSPFAGIAYPWDGAARLADIDSDGDLDLFLSNYGDMFYFENTGTAQSPAFTERTGTDNPMYSARFFNYGTAYQVFTDLDHDGDLDMIFNGSTVYGQPAMMYMENTGTPETPLFEAVDITLFSEMNNTGKTFFVDYDGDGDLDAFAGTNGSNDAFAGTYDGIVNYLENQNPAVTTTVTGTVVLYDSNGSPVVVEPDLTIVDADNDTIIYATVVIENYQAGETLTFTPQAGITGTFDTGTGVLTFRGKATVADYQASLRTVTFEMVAAGGRKRSPKKSIIDKTISFAVYDLDFTTPQIAAKSLQIFINEAPTINAQSINLTVGGSTSVDLKVLINDPDGAADLDMGSLKITQEPASGAATSIDGNGILTIDYATLNYLGTETMTVEVCDLNGLCAQNIVTITVTNTPPVITPETVSTPGGTIKTVNLIGITSDVDDNLDPDSFTIVSGPSSGAEATIQVVSPTEVNLLLNYEGITLDGTDQITIRACDRAGACSENVVTVLVSVSSEVIVYNAIAPSSSFDNRFMRITGLPSGNKVSIFNRWGDKVYDVKNYENSESGNVFKGLNNNGNSLPSGTYFYTIEVPGQETITGYLTLKQ